MAENSGNSNPRTSHVNNSFQAEVAEITNMLNRATIEEGNLLSTLSSLNKSDWILQVSSKNHLCNSLDLFTSYSSIEPLEVTLGSGRIITTNICGIVTLNEYITLYNVFFVPEIGVNTISVGKLSKDIECEVMIGGGFCVIQELNGTNVLGMAKVVEGWYRFLLDTHLVLNSVTESNWILQQPVSSTNHICRSLDWFTISWSILPLQIKLGNGTIVTTEVAGIIQLTDSLILYDVLFVPEFDFNVISAGQLMEDLNCEVVTIGESYCVIKEPNGGKVFGAAELFETKYHLQLDFLRPLCYTDHLGPNLSRTNLPNCNCCIWHLKLGHLSHNMMVALKAKHDEIPLIIPNLADCAVCNLVGISEKLSQSSYNFGKSETVFELIHLITWKPYCVISTPSFNRALTIVDDFSGYHWTYLLRGGEWDVRTCIEGFVALVESNFNKKIKTISSNGETDFQHGDFYSSQGITHITSSLKMPQQNGIFESILNMSKALLEQSNITDLYWGFAILHSAYLLNRIPLLGNKSAFETLHGKLPDLSILPVFGCLCYTPQQPAKKYVFLGFKDETKSCFSLDITTNDILEFESLQDVIFCDSEFPFDENSAPPSMTT